MNNSDLNIFSVYHKDFAIPQCDFITPIQVGKNFTQLELGMCSDNEGENISDKNQTHGELTALYWIWKHLNTFKSNYIGFCHYRRYFVQQRVKVKDKILFKKIKADPADMYIGQLNEENLSRVSSIGLKDQLLTLLKDADILLPKRTVLALKKGQLFSIKDHYIYHHIKEDWYLMREATIKLYPELAETFDRFFDEQTEMHCYNMMVCSKDIFDAYCTWLFPIVTVLEKTVKLSEYPYQRRIFGFFSERLLNLYVYSKKLKVAELPVLYLEH